MNRLLLIVIGFMMISQISGDICDICVCTSTDCEPAKNDTGNACSDAADEFFACDGVRNDDVDETHQPIDLNSIQWPKRNTTVSARFNHFKLTYLTK